MNKFIKYLKDPYYQIGKLILRHCPKLMSDKYYISVAWQKFFGYKLPWKNPRTFNEKLQWLKLNDHNPLYTTLVDKYAVKQWISENIGAEYVIPTLGVWQSAEDIDIEKLPNQFVLKCTHDSGSVVICRDKSLFNFDEAKTKLSEALKQNYYYVAREWPYLNVPHRIIAEPLLKETNSDELHDYKFYCFNGKTEYFGYSIGEAAHNVKNLKFNRSLDNIDNLFKQQPSLNKDLVTFPENINKMILLADDIAQAVPSPHIRVDMYNIDGKIYLGELTFYSSAGYISIYNKEYSQYLADLIKIKHVK